MHKLWLYAWLFFKTALVARIRAVYNDIVVLETRIALVDLKYFFFDIVFDPHCDHSLF